MIAFIATAKVVEQAFEASEIPADGVACWVMTPAELAGFVEAEREACAKIADEQEKDGSGEWALAAKTMAAIIRNRSQQ